MKRNLKKIFGLTLAAAVMLSGCGQSSSGASSSGSSVSGSGKKLLMTVSDGSDTFRATLAQAAQDTAAQIGATLDVADAQGSIEAQVQQIRTAQEQGYDAVLCCPVDTDTAVQLEESAGDIPIVFMNSCPDDKRLEADKYMFVGSDELVAGTFQAEYALEKLSAKNEINVLIFKGEKNHSATKGRTEAVKNTFADSGKNVNIVFEDYADWSTDKAADMFKIFLSLGVPYDCVICNNDSMALGIIAACRDEGIDPSSFPVMGVDATADGCAAIADGDMAFTVYQSAAGQGEAGVMVAVALAGGQSASASGFDVSDDGKYVWVPFERVDASNVGEYQ